MENKINAEEMIIMPLGGGQEVGRSCILLKYQFRSILLDCGCHPGREGADSLPFFDYLDSSDEIDLILITHFHIDHCAALPYFTEKTNFKGRIFMTHATKAVMRLLLADNIRLQHRSAPLYTEQDLQHCIDKVEVLDYHETIEHKGIKFSATAAGHVLGAAMFMIDIDGIRVLYTGDYSLEADRHLMGAEIPPGGPPDVMICESTFGTTTLDSKEKREESLINAVENIVLKGGNCLIPVFALGRAQELLLILDQYWQDHINLQRIPIFYASKLASKSLRVYQTFINMMNNQVTDMMDQFNNPFKLKHIKSIQNSDFELSSPCIVMASPGFLQNGVSRQLFENWCDDERNGIVIAGYTIEGTLAHELLSMPLEIKCLDNRIKPRRCQIASVSFSAHVDYQQNKSFMKAVMPDYIILVHGEKTQMKRLKEGLESEMRKNNWSTQHKPCIATPDNGVKVRLRFKKNINAEIVGSTATNLLTQLDNFHNTTTIDQNNNNNSNSNNGILKLSENSLLITENFNSKVVTTSELSNFTSCKFGNICEKLMIPLPHDLGSIIGMMVMKSEEIERKVIDYLIGHLEEVFDDIVILSGTSSSSSIDSDGINPVGIDGINYSNDVRTSCYRVVIQSLVTLSVGYSSSSSSFSTSSNISPLIGLSSSNQRCSYVQMEWSGSPISDTVADCITGLIMQAFSTINVLRHSITTNKISTTKSSSSSSSSSSMTNATGNRAKNGLNAKKRRVDPLQPSRSSSSSSSSRGVTDFDIKGEGFGAAIIHDDVLMMGMKSELM
jgi:cleavage and polyadenylation specificity factor subunit 3